MRPFTYVNTVSKADDPCGKGYKRAHMPAAALPEAAKYMGDRIDVHPTAHFHGETQASWEKICRNGNTVAVEQARKIAKGVEARVPLGAAVPHMEPSVAGGAVCAPAVLAGTPLCFQRPVWRADATTPLSIWVDIGCSAAVSVEQMLKRGAALLAMAMAVQQHRPVRLSAFANFNSGKDALMSIDMGVSPLDWARCATVLGTVAASRIFCFQTSDMLSGRTRHGGMITWGGGYSGFGQDPRTGNQRLRERLGLGENDLLFDRGFSEDKGLMADPVKWVLSAMKRWTDIEMPD